MPQNISPAYRFTGILLLPLSVAATIFSGFTLPDLLAKNNPTEISSAAPPSYESQVDLVHNGSSSEKSTNSIPEISLELAGNTKNTTTTAIKGNGKKTTTPAPTPTAEPTVEPFSPVTEPTETAAAPQPVTSPAPVASSAPVYSSSNDISSARLRFGVVNPSGPLGSTELDTIATVAGEKPSILLFYKDFTQPAPITEINATAARGATPIVTWEPWVANGNPTQSAYTLDAIASGQYDAYLKSWGNAIKNNGTPVTLRFAHEMNGNWYPWSEGINGNESGDYVRAWKHVHDVVESTGATNITWLWAPNAPYWGSTDLAGLYPGDNYVDQVGLDGYNWGTTQSWGSTWQSPQQIFASGLSTLRTLAPGKDIIITEVGSAELGGSKSQWNQDLITYLAAQSDVTGFVWFNLNKEVDWRIESSTTSRDAFRSVLDWREAN